MTTQPLIVRRGDGSIESVLQCSDKSRSKSIEHDELWIVDPDTHRVLPYLGGRRRFDHFALRRGIDPTPDWYETTVVEESTRDGAHPDAESDAPEVGPQHAGKGGSRVGEAPSPGTAGTAPSASGQPGRPRSAPASPPTAGDRGTGAAGAPYEFLATLTEIIAERRRALPEGSYTTHLFTKGESKIRKKTGEEAVELILAENDEELLSESADLVYHLMVLLEVRGLSIGDVVGHLKRRHADG